MQDEKSNIVGAIAQGVGVLADLGKKAVEKSQSGDKARAEAIDLMFQKKQQETELINAEAKRKERQKSVLIIFGGVLFVSLIIIIAVKMKKQK